MNIGWVGVNQFTTLIRKRTEIRYSVILNEFAGNIPAAPYINNLLVNIDSNITGCWPFVAHHSSSTKVGFNICLVHWHQVDESLIALAFTTGISHALIIVISDDDVNYNRYWCTRSFTTKYIINNLIVRFL